MGKKQKKHKAKWRSSYEDYAKKPLKLVLKVGGSEVTELSGSGHNSSYYDDRSDHERERHKEKKKKKSEKEKHLNDEERRKQKGREEAEHCDTEGEADDFDPGKKVEVEPPPDRPVRACWTQPAENEMFFFSAVFHYLLSLMKVLKITMQIHARLY
uniref:Bromodomain containing 9 n=1 Tax=Nomascus leucogenys TaxID=61853 RepID=A0A2I3HHI9_NOMLE